VAQSTVAAVTAALEPLRNMLTCDGYSMDVSGEPLIIRLTASDAACAECLVPPSLMRPMISEMLSAAGLPASYELRYPPEHHAGSAAEREAGAR
jgi:hypothetical protein